MSGLNKSMGVIAQEVEDLLFYNDGLSPTLSSQLRQQFICGFRHWQNRKSRITLRDCLDELNRRTGDVVVVFQKRTGI